MGGINKHHPNHFLRILCGLQAHRESPKRVADEHIGSFRSGVGQERAQFTNDSLSCSRHRVGVAPAEASAIIAASAGELCHIGTDQRPAQRGATERGLEYHRWTIHSLKYGLPSKLIPVGFAMRIS